ncbi:trypsin-like serine protease [uncultured Shewanella sp.]|uniref:trypsin-like serine peptidase n=1 Tax=uncultured Shewanella sp. TaxID=173975 RepID=UPI0026176F27|nr:trypsin-like serine protease [uncultured Shewanella sp.]
MITNVKSIKKNSCNKLFLFAFLFIATPLFAVDMDEKTKQTHIIRLNDTANFIHNGEAANPTPPYYLGNAEQQEIYSDEELSQAFTAIAVSKNGELFSSSISIDDLKQFNNQTYLEQYSDYFQDKMQQSSAYYSGTFNIDNIIKPMVIMGEDNRKQVTNPALSSPYWLIGRIDVGCTGTLIGKSHVLTAGHCIADGNGNWYSNLDFTTAQNGHYKPWNKCSWKKAITTEAWFKEGNSNFDYGLIVLDCNANGGSLGFGPYVSGTHSITGYASEKPYATMWTDSGPVTSTPYRLCYQIDTSNGVSGSAIVDSQGYVRGVHTTGSPTKNCGTRITYEVYSTLHYWMELYQ